MNRHFQFTADSKKGAMNAPEMIPYAIEAFPLGGCLFEWTSSEHTSAQERPNSTTAIGVALDDVPWND